MLETIREYAVDKLAERGEADKLARSHALYSPTRTGAIGLRIYSAEAQHHLAWMAWNTITCAPPWPGAWSRGMISGWLSRSFRAYWFWFRRGHLREGANGAGASSRKWTAAPDPELATMLFFSAMLRWQGDLEGGCKRNQGRMQMAQKLEDEMLMGCSSDGGRSASLNRGNGAEAFPVLEKALELFQEMHFTFIVPNAMIHLANAALALGDIPAARATWNRPCPWPKQIGEEWLIASIINNQGEVARTQRDYHQAQVYYQQSEAIFRKLGDIEDHNRLIHSLGYIALYQGDLETADQRFHESLTVFRELGNRRGIAECLAGLARLALMRGNPPGPPRCWPPPRPLSTPGRGLVAG